MAQQYVPTNYAGDGSTTSFAIPWPYLNKTDVQITVDGAITTDFTWTSSATINLYAAPAVGSSVTIQRNTNAWTMVTNFTAGDLTAVSLNRAFYQLLYVLQELYVAVTNPVAFAALAGFVFSGPWNSGTYYLEGTTVSYSGGSWRAMVANTSIVPGTDGGVTWFPLALQGDPGASGATAVVGGQTTVNFGTGLGSNIATTTVSDTGVLATSAINVRLIGVATADHSADEHVVDNITVTPTNIIPGVSFDIIALSTGLWPLTRGAYTVSWIRK